MGGNLFKLCRKCGVNYCETGYCCHCREKDKSEKYIKAHQSKIQNKKCEVIKHDSNRSAL